MKKIFFILFTLLFSQLFAQSAFKPIGSVDNFKAALSKESNQVNTIESEFSQVKYMEMLSENIVSKGKFYFKKSNKICLDYTSPIKYLIVINNQKIKIVSEGKKNVYALNSNKMMEQMNSLLSACMTGNLNLLSSDYQLEYKENDSQYWIKIKPQGSVKSFMKEIDIYLNKKDLSVDRLKMIEPSLDYTEYTFSNKKKNTPIADEKFSVN